MVNSGGAKKSPQSHNQPELKRKLKVLNYASFSPINDCQYLYICCVCLQSSRAK